MASGWYFEDFQLNQEITSPGRTITEADVVMFAGLSGDYNQLHTDEQFAQQTMFKRRIAHGMLILGIASGLIARLGFIEGTAIAFRELNWKFVQPVFMGDTIRVRAITRELKPMERLGGGLVTMEVQVINHHDEVVQKGEWRILMKSRKV